MWTVPWYLKALVVPPANLLLAALLGALLLPRRRRLGRALIALSLLGLYALSTPYAADTLLRTVESAPPLTPERFEAGAGAIVVLSAGTYGLAPEYGEPTVSATTLERVRYSARLHRLTGRPLLLTGGDVAGGSEALASTMARTLASAFSVTARWIETDALNTYQNAVNSAAILETQGIARVYLVTHAWHMRRARAAFEAAGLAVVPAPVASTAPPAATPRAFVPTADALAASALAFHEWLGLLWYRIAYF